MAETAARVQVFECPKRTCHHPLTLHDVQTTGDGNYTFIICKVTLHELA